MRTHRLRILPTLAIAAVLAAGVTGAGASTFLKQSVADLIQSSRGIVHAQVTDIRSEWNAEHNFIISFVTQHAYETVRVPGGVVDGYRVVMEGAPDFQVGDNVVVFLGAWDDGALMVEGYYQGLSKVERDAAGNEMLKGGSAHGLSMAQLAKQIAASGK
jgi:hypothetical protein